MTDITDPILRGELRSWITSSLVGALLIGALLWLSTFILPEDDHLGMVRGVVSKSISALFSIVIINGALLFLERVFPGEYFVQIEKDPVACAVLAVGYLYAFTNLVPYM